MKSASQLCTSKSIVPRFSGFQSARRITLLFIQNVVQPKGQQIQNYNFTTTYRVLSRDYIFNFKITLLQIQQAITKLNNAFTIKNTKQYISKYNMLLGN